MGNIFGWIGNLFFILGAIFLARKWISGWYCQIIANLCHVMFSILVGIEAISIGALSILLIILNYYGIKKWRKSQWIPMEKN